ncbi:hypothetical protein P9J64_00780 [Deltaproteobacteria bacterium IMCC39524]|nr:hypothetical protein [Deltaproteobacteria bacterium IMCC39524]
MKAIQKNTDSEDNQLVDASRRDFLRKSVYAAYATPLITTLLVQKASAAASSAGTNNPNCQDPVWSALRPGVCE